MTSTQNEQDNQKLCNVLILAIVDNVMKQIVTITGENVLILVVMDDGLVHLYHKAYLNVV
mgnify:CR=1 FL=1